MDDGPLVRGKFAKGFGQFLAEDVLVRVGAFGKERERIRGPAGRSFFRRVSRRRIKSMAALWARRRRKAAFVAHAAKQSGTAAQLDKQFLQDVEGVRFACAAG